VSVVLLDTNIFSYRHKQDSRAAIYEPDIAGRQVCISFQTVAELRRWAISHNWGTQQRTRLELVLSTTTVIPYDDSMAHRWAEIVVARTRIGRPISEGDAWIAATALRHIIPLLTHNATDFADIPGLTVVSH
jgi:tRNA(fMet)-specific endonuclease VapC